MRSLRLQLLFSHLVLVLLMGLVMGGAILAFFQIGKSIDQVLRDNFRTVLAASQFQTSLSKQDTAFGMLASGDNAAAVRQYVEASHSADQALDDIRASVTEDDETSVVAAMAVSYIRYRQLGNQIMGANEMSLQPGTIQLIRRTIRPDLDEMISKAAQVQRLNELEIREANRLAQQRAQEYFMRSMGVTVVAILLAVLLALRMVRMALTPLAILARHAERIAQGELEHQVKFPRKDEIGALADTFNEMARRLAEVRRSDVRRLQRAQQMSDAALESLYDPVLVTDAKSRIVHLNRAAEGLFGSVPPSPRRPLAEHIEDKRIVKAIGRAIREEFSRGDEEGSLVTIKVGESERTYRLRATPMKDQTGTLLGSVAVFEDITHLREIDRLKTEFIGVASHELRTPVTSLMLSVQLLLEGAVGDLNPEQKEIISAQQQDLERLEKLMRDLLDVTRLEAGSLPPRFELVAPDELVRSPVNGLKAVAAKKDVKLELETAQDIGKVRADRVQIGRVLTNLISNAIRHTEPGGSVTVRTRPSSEGVLFEVADTGEGIPEEYLGSIFERFVQVPGATQGGAGLGLSIATHIVQAHGGRMNVESQVGKGSVFSFTLPSETAAEEKEED
jgi:signal transduction histidine kinase/HAMP domain-containing protein